jgi:hypothetical protein
MAREIEMKPEEISVGDNLMVRGSFFGTSSKPVPVVITAKHKARAEGGFLFLTEPPVASGTGLCASWFQSKDEA